MAAVADAGPLIHLNEIGCLALLEIFETLHNLDRHTINFRSGADDANLLQGSVDKDRRIGNARLTVLFCLLQPQTGVK
jgi:hypothetical protein